MLRFKELKKHLKELEESINNDGMALLSYNPENHTSVYITNDIIKKCKKGKVWNTPALLCTLQNCWYGIDPVKMKSPGGKDGIFLLDRDYKPKNEMQRKIFDQCIDKPGSAFMNYCDQFNVNPNNVLAVRVVSHHMRLLGILLKNDKTNTIVLVNYDNTKE
jgi:hypothetical protein